MARVWVPNTALRLTNDKAMVEAEGKTVAEVVRNLDQAYPGLGALLVRDDALQPGITVAVDGTVSNRQLLQPVGPDSEIHFIPAIFGG